MIKFNRKAPRPDMIENLDLSKIITKRKETGSNSRIGNLLETAKRDWKLFGKILKHPKMFISFYI